MDQGDRVRRLSGAFPATLSADLDQVLAVVPTATHEPSKMDVGPVVVGNERVFIPSRIYFPEPTVADSLGLSERQLRLLCCLYTRHNDGFVRQKYVESLLSSTEMWVAPFIVALLGE